MLDEAVNFDWWLTAASWSPPAGPKMEVVTLPPRWQLVVDFIREVFQGGKTGEEASNYWNIDTHGHLYVSPLSHVII